MCDPTAVFKDSMYGEVFAFMRRKVADRVITEDIRRIPVDAPSDSDKERIARQILLLLS